MTSVEKGGQKQLQTAQNNPGDEFCGGLTKSSDAKPTSQNAKQSTKELMTYTAIIGLVLMLVVLVSAVLGLGGIWGWFNGDYTWQVFLTFLVCGGAVIGVTYVAHVFLGLS